MPPNAHRLKLWPNWGRRDHKENMCRTHLPQQQTHFFPTVRVFFFWNLIAFLHLFEMKIQRCFWMTAKPPVVSLHLYLFDFRQMAGSRPSTPPKKLPQPTDQPTSQTNQPKPKPNPPSRGAFAIGSVVLKWHLCDAPTFDLAEWRRGRVDAGAGHHGAWIEVKSATGVWHPWAGLLQRHWVFLMDAFFEEKKRVSGDVKMLKVGLRFFFGSFWSKTLSFFCGESGVFHPLQTLPIGIELQIRSRDDVKQRCHLRRYWYDHKEWYLLHPIFLFPWGVGGWQPKTRDFDT